VGIHENVEAIASTLPSAIRTVASFNNANGKGCVMEASHKISGVLGLLYLVVARLA
jgi:hypothetical protein